MVSTQLSSKKLLRKIGEELLLRAISRKPRKSSLSVENEMSSVFLKERFVGHGPGAMGYTIYIIYKYIDYIGILSDDEMIPKIEEINEQL